MSVKSQLGAIVADLGQLVEAPLGSALEGLEGLLGELEEALDGAGNEEVVAAKAALYGIKTRIDEVLPEIEEHRQTIAAYMHRI